MNTSIATTIAVNTNTITNITTNIIMTTTSIATMTTADAMMTTADAVIPALATAEKTATKSNAIWLLSESAPVFLPLASFRF